MRIQVTWDGFLVKNLYLSQITNHRASTPKAGEGNIAKDKKAPKVWNGITMKKFFHVSELKYKNKFPQ